MKILSRNVTGMNSMTKQHQVINQCRNYDISLLQETKLDHRNTTFLKSKWGSDHVFLSSPGNSRRGCITLIHPRCAPQIIHGISDPNGQFIITLVRIRDENFAIINTYGNPDTDAASLATFTSINEKLEDIQRLFSIDHFIMGGDFNFVLEQRDTSSTSRKPRAEGQLITIINNFDLFDVAGLLSQNPRHTYFRARRENTSARYDRFYVSQNLLQGIEYKILRRTGDHAPIEISFQQQKHNRNWKFTDTLITNPQFLQELHDCIKATLSPLANSPNARLVDLQHLIDFNEHSPTAILNSLTEDVRNLCMRKTRELRAKQKSDETKILSEFIAARDAVNNSSPPTDDQINNYEKAQERLHMYQTRRQQGASDRNLVTYATLGERTTRYHFAKSNRGKASREINRLITSTDQGQALLEGYDLRNLMYEKYKQLSQPDPQACTISIQQFLGTDLLASLRKCPPDQHRYLTSPVLSSEIKHIIKDLKHNSAPGPLGYSNALIKEISTFMTNILVEAGNELLFSDNPTFLPWLFHRFVIFILKPGKPTTCPDSYRGLSMLEGYFKIFSKILANRMQNAMLHIQNPQQFGFTKGKGILEASRTVLDITQYAKKQNLPLILISTDFYKAFDSIAHKHIENCLEIYGFPDEFKTAFMRLTKGTVQFEVNGELSEDVEVLKGTGQGDPKSSFGFNISSAPLNHFLASSPSVPRFEHRNEQVDPVFFADDAMLILKGNEVQAILNLLTKISEYYFVSGLKLNLSKCEILPINCRDDDIATLLQATGMKRVTVLKHLGIHIDTDGCLPHAKNIAPLATIMNKIADSFNSSLSTPIGRSLYAKFLLGSKYLHRIQNFHFSMDQLEDLRKSVLRLTWTRARPNEDNHSIRTHISQNRVAQPPYFGGLSVPDPIIQSKSLSFAWAKKFCKCNQSLTWTKILEATLLHHRRPTISQHTSMGPREWEKTAETIEQDSKFWSEIFRSIGHIVKLSHEFDKNWNLIPLLGYEHSPQTNDISSLSFQNPAARNLFQNGLRVFGQLFNYNDLGHLIPSSMKTYQALEAEFDVQIPMTLRNSIATLIRSIKQKFRSSIVGGSQLFENISTLQSLVRASPTGCRQATRLLLREQRTTWQWGEFPRSFSTFLSEDMINISARDFSKSFCRTRSNLLPPPIQWTSLTILLRTMWTNVKEANTSRTDVNNLTAHLCSNCGQLPEHTLHLMYNCPLAQQTWDVLLEEFNLEMQSESTTIQPITLTSDLIMFNHPPNHLPDTFVDSLINIIMTAKHRLYRLRFRDNMQRFPSRRASLLSIALDLEKVILIRYHSGLDCSFLENFNNRIKAIVGL